MAEEAYSRLQVLAVKRSMNPSLITAHEPAGEIFNTDGNGGIPQVVNAMLLFSRVGRIDLLPALPAAWPNGDVKGLRAKGGFEVDLQWKDNKLVAVRLTSLQGNPVQVRLGDQTAKVTVKKGSTVTLDAKLQVVDSPLK
jgi:alpha-L-fucosidase 2